MRSYLFANFFSEMFISSIDTGSTPMPTLLPDQDKEREKPDQLTWTARSFIRGVINCRYGGVGC